MCAQIAETFVKDRSQISRAAEILCVYERAGRAAHTAQTGTLEAWSVSQVTRAVGQGDRSKIAGDWVWHNVLFAEPATEGAVLESWESGCPVALLGLLVISTP